MGNRSVKESLSLFRIIEVIITFPNKGDFLVSFISYITISFQITISTNNLCMGKSWEGFGTSLLNRFFFLPLLDISCYYKLNWLFKVSTDLGHFKSKGSTGKKLF